MSVELPLENFQVWNNAKENYCQGNFIESSNYSNAVSTLYTRHRAEKQGVFILLAASLQIASRCRHAEEYIAHLGNYSRQRNERVVYCYKGSRKYTSVLYRLYKGLVKPCQVAKEVLFKEF